MRKYHLSLSLAHQRGYEADEEQELEIESENSNDALVDGLAQLHLDSLDEVEGIVINEVTEYA